jgi:hypothetical protein
LDDLCSIPDNARFTTASRPALRLTKPLTQWVLGAVTPGIKRHGLENAPSTPSSAEVKKGGVISPLPHMSTLLNA